MGDPSPPAAIFAAGIQPKLELIDDSFFDDEPTALATPAMPSRDATSSSFSRSSASQRTGSDEATVARNRCCPDTSGSAGTQAAHVDEDEDDEEDVLPLIDDPEDTV